MTALNKDNNIYQIILSLCNYDFMFEICDFAAGIQ